MTELLERTKHLENAFGAYKRTALGVLTTPGDLARLFAGPLLGVAAGCWAMRQGYPGLAIGLTAALTALPLVLVCLVREAFVTHSFPAGVGAELNRLTLCGTASERQARLVRLADTFRFAVQGNDGMHLTENLLEAALIASRSTSAQTFRAGVVLTPLQERQKAEQACWQRCMAAAELGDDGRRVLGYTWVSPTGDPVLPWRAHLSTLAATEKAARAHVEVVRKIPHLGAARAKLEQLERGQLARVVMLADAAPAERLGVTLVSAESRGLHLGAWMLAAGPEHLAEIWDQDVGDPHAYRLIVAVVPLEGPPTELDREQLAPGLVSGGVS